MSLNSLHLSADRPVRTPEKDALEFAPFAKHLAESIVAMAPPQGMVVAVNGAWGSGKSSLLNFVRWYLKSQDPAPQILEFNPWWFAGKEDLTRVFFAELMNVVAPDGAGAFELRQRIGRFAELFAAAPIPGAAALRTVGEWVQSYKDAVPELKATLENELSAHTGRVVVVIDDIDRLGVAQIREIFRLVKVVADFPNILYLLAFDENVVSTALSEGGLSGQDYLEKIVQVRVDLPVPDSIHLEGMFVMMIETVFEEVKETIDKEYLRDVYQGGLRRLLSTPRKIVSLENSLKLLFPSVKDEVNPVDFMVIEALRIFQPRVYDEIRFNQDLFAGTPPADTEMNAGDVEQQRSRCRNVAQRAGIDRDRNLTALLGRVFPKFGWALEERHEEFEPQRWRHERRACSEQRIAVYFQYALPLGVLPATELRSLLDAAGEPQHFAAQMQRMAAEPVRPGGHSLAAQALVALDDRVEQLDHDTCADLLRALLEAGDHALAVEDTGGDWLELNNLHRQGRLIHRLLARLPEERRMTVLNQSVTDGSALGTIVDTVSYLGDQHGKYSGEASPPDQILLNEGAVEQLEQATIPRIQQAARANTFLTTPTVIQILYRWGSWGDGKDMTRYFKDTLGDQENMLLFLRAFIPDHAIAPHRDPMEVLRRLPYSDNLNRLIDPAEFRDVIERLSRRDDLRPLDRTRVDFLMSETKRAQTAMEPTDQEGTEQD